MKDKTAEETNVVEAPKKVYGSFLKDQVLKVKPVESSGRWANLLVSGQENNIIEKIINKIIEVYNLHFKDDLLNKKLLIRLNNKVNQYFLNTLSNSEIDTNINHVNEKDTDVNHVNEKDTDNSIKNKLLNLISMRLASKQENIHEIKNYFFDISKWLYYLVGAA